MDRTKALAALAALANDTRLDLVRRLIPAGESGLAAGEIADALGVSASRLSFHLSALQGAGLVTARRESRNVIYAANRGGIGALISYIVDDCCCADPGIRACCAPRENS
jgi:DNA-binding transcriptional ArsR family regulator